MLAIGPNSAPSGPDIENSGMKAHTMIVVEKNRARSISFEASMIRSISDRERSTPGRRDVAVDVLDDDGRAVDDDSEVDRADRQQVGRLALDVEHGDREQECQRDHDARRCPRSRYRPGR